MVSREGEEAERQEVESPLSTPPRMGSIKASSSDPLQNRLYVESCQRIGGREVVLRNNTVVGCASSGDEVLSEGIVGHTMKETDSQQTMGDAEEMKTHVTTIPQISNGKRAKIWKFKVLLSNKRMFRAIKEYI